MKDYTKRQKILIVLGVSLFILTGSGITYAALTWATSNPINIGLTIGCFEINYTPGGAINNANIEVMNESTLISNNKFTITEGIALTYANIGIKSTCSIEGCGIFVDAMHDKERVSETVITGVTPTRTLTWTGKVAIPYPSDYGYAADLSLCQKQLASYNAATYTANNWMKNIVTNNSGNSGWLLTPYSGYAGGAWLVDSSGSIYDDYDYYVFNAFGVAPVLSLISELDIGSGSGTNSLPYQLSV